MQPPIRIAVLDCDDTNPGSRHAGYTDWFAILLRAGAKSLGQLSPERDLQISGYNVVTEPDRYPEDREIDAVLLSGSKYDSFSDDPWIVKLVEYTTRILKETNIRVIGVCFGHQIVGRALGAKVGRCELGWELSVTPLKMTQKGQELFKKDIMSLNQMHRDVVYEYPDGVEALCSTPICKVHGMYVGGKLITVQGHPEFDSKAMNWLLDTRHAQGRIPEELYQDAKARAGNQHDGVLVAEGFLRFLLEPGNMIQCQGKF